MVLQTLCKIKLIEERYHEDFRVKFHRESTGDFNLNYFIFIQFLDTFASRKDILLFRFQQSIREQSTASEKISGRIFKTTFDARFIRFHSYSLLRLVFARTWQLTRGNAHGDTAGANDATRRHVNCIVNCIARSALYVRSSNYRSTVPAVSEQVVTSATSLV